MSLRTEKNREEKIWPLPGRTLALGARTRIMAIVNITPDSFSDGGAFFSTKKAVAHALDALDAGAAILDLGAESTRPGSQAGGADPVVSADAEQARLLPVLEGILKERPQAVISVDTYKAATARAALKAGAAIINDVSGFFWDAEMAAVCAEFQAGVIVGHTRGLPEEWAAQPALDDDAVMRVVHDGLAGSLSIAAQAGLHQEKIVLDPCYGFGKRFDENFALLARQQELLALGCPLLTGLSRKSFLGHALTPLHDGQDAPAAERENASLAALVAAILHGASIVRVHAVRPAVEAACVADAILRHANRSQARD
jgi:dihydropteroate synthase